MRDQLSGIIQHAMQVMPFFLTAGDNGTRLNVARIIESLITAIIAAGVVLYGTVQVLDSKVQAVQRSIEINREAIIHNSDKFDRYIESLVNQQNRHR